MRLSQFEKRIDATLEHKLARMKDVVDFTSVGDPNSGGDDVKEVKHKIQMYVRMERRTTTTVETNDHQDGDDKKSGGDQAETNGTAAAPTGTESGGGLDLFFYGEVERCVTPVDLHAKVSSSSLNATPGGSTTQGDTKVDRPTTTDSPVVAMETSPTTTSPQATAGEKEKEKESSEGKVYLTDVLKSVTARGKKLNLDMEDERAYEDVTFTWLASEHSGGKASDCLRVDCTDLLPGSKVDITWEVKGQPKKYLLPQELSQVLGMTSDTKTNIISRLWQFIKLKGLSTSNEPATVEFTSPQLKAFFSGGGGEVKLPMIGQKLRKCLVPVGQQVLQYVIPKPNEESEFVKSLSFVTAIPSDVLPYSGPPPGGASEADKLLRKVRHTRAVDLIDKDIKKMVEEINDRKRKRNFFMGFSQSPVDFITSLLESQQRDLKTMKNFQTNYPTSYSQRSHLFKDAWVHDATIRYLHQRVASDIIDKQQQQ